MEILSFVRSFRHLFLLIVLLSMAAGIITYRMLSLNPPIYAAQSTIQFGWAGPVTNPNSSAKNEFPIKTGEKQELVGIDPEGYERVLQNTIQKLQLDMAPAQLDQLFTSHRIKDTSLLTISVQYRDPVLVADIANGLAYELVYSYYLAPLPHADEIAELRIQIENLMNWLEPAREGILSIDSQLRHATGIQRSILSMMRMVLGAQVNKLLSDNAQLNAVLASMESQGSCCTVYVIDTARIPNTPINPPDYPTTALVTGVVFVVCCLEVAASRIVRSQRSV